MRFLVIVFFSFSLVSCSSWFKRRECNKTNWFTHGEKVAMSGKRLDEDSFINECRKVPEERKAARDGLQDDVRNVGYKIQSKQRERKVKQQEISDLRREMVKL